MIISLTKKNLFKTMFIVCSIHSLVPPILLVYFRVLLYHCFSVFYEEVQVQIIQECINSQRISVSLSF